MSDYNGSSQSIPTYTPMDALDNDGFVLDCRNAMSLRNDTIASAALVAVTRVDGAAMGDDDLDVTAVQVISAGTTVVLATGPIKAGAGVFVGWNASGGIPGSVYQVKLRLTLASSAVLNRIVNIVVPPYVA